MKWDQATYLARVKDFVSDYEEAIVKVLPEILKEVKGSMNEGSVGTSLKSFIKEPGGKTPAGEYLEAYLQAIEKIKDTTKFSVLDVLAGTYDLIKMTKTIHSPPQLKTIENKRNMDELIIIFKQIIDLCFDTKGNPTRNLIRFRGFLDIDGLKK